MRKGIIALVLAMAIVALSGVVSAFDLQGTQWYKFTDAKTTTSGTPVLFQSGASQDLFAGTQLRAEADLQNYQPQYYNAITGGSPAKVATAAIQEGTSSIQLAPGTIVTEGGKTISVDKFTFCNEIKSAVHFETLEGSVDSAVSDLTSNAYSKGTAYTDFAKIQEVDQFVGTGSGKSGVSWIKAGNMWVATDDKDPVTGQTIYTPSVELKDGTLGYVAGSDATVYKEGMTDDLALISAHAWVGGDVDGKAIHLNDIDPLTKDFAGVFISGDFQWDARLDQDAFHF
jgi:hypothetical protein